MKLNKKTIKEQENILLDTSNNEDIENLKELILKEKFDNPIVPGQLIVKFKEKRILERLCSKSTIKSTGVPSIDILNKKYGLQSHKTMFNRIIENKFSKFIILNLANGTNIFEASKEYSKNPNIEYAEPNYVYQYCTDPNDPYYSVQWSLNNIGQEYPVKKGISKLGKVDADIDAPEAWGITKGSSEIVVAVIDTGVDYTHSDLEDNIWINNDEIANNRRDDDRNGYVDDRIGWNFDENNNDPLDDYGHGTHCAGIISATSNNNIGVSGVCWNCKIMPIKTLLTSELIAESIIYATDNGANVISMSFGGYAHSQAKYDAINYAYENNVVLVASAGNGNTSRVHFPSGYNNVISVAATNSKDQRATFSNYGEWIDVAAPGRDILSLRAKNTDMYEDGGEHNIDDKYMVASGTSMAAPHIAGVAALLLSHNSSLTPEMIQTIIPNSIDQVSSEGYYIRGRINAFEALNKEPATALLSQAYAWRNAKGEIEIWGNVNANNLENYVIDYGKGREPQDWIIINESNKPKQGFLTILNTTTLDETLYTIRLRLSANNEIYEDRIWIIVNNVQNTFHVDDDNTQGPWKGTLNHPYKEIRDGVNYAGYNDIIFVHNGTYYETIKIQGSINLIGEDKTNTIIDAQENGSVIQLQSNDILIKNFTIKNANNSLYMAGIKLDKLLENIEILNNNIINCYGGLFLEGAYNCTISENYLFNSSIILFLSCMSNTIQRNVVENSELGIGIAAGFFNKIKENKLFENECGIMTSVSMTNIIINNNISGCDKGIFLFIWGRNFIIKNNFIDNKRHAQFFNSRLNFWYGNYWDNWVGLKSVLFRFIPKVVWGVILPFSRPQFDLNPAKEPYDI
jgi:parallel beta-helix repeat protein